MNKRIKGLYRAMAQGPLTPLAPKCAIAYVIFRHASVPQDPSLIQGPMSEAHAPAKGDFLLYFLGWRHGMDHFGTWARRRMHEHGEGAARCANFESDHARHEGQANCSSPGSTQEYHRQNPPKTRDLATSGDHEK